MKIVILTIGSMGDVRPYLALGAGLKAAGFEVTLASHQEFESLIRSQGLDFAPIRGNPREILQSHEGQALLQSGKDILKFARRMRLAAAELFEQTCDDCLAASQGADALILSILAAGLGSMIARSLKIKTILGFLQPLTPTGAFASMTLPTLYLGGFLNRLSHSLTREVFWQVFREPLDKWGRSQLGLGAERFAAYSKLERQSLVLYGYSRFLVPRPADWRSNIHVTGYWLLPEGRNYQPEQELQAFLDEGPAPVYIGFGSMASANPQQLTQWVLQALKASKQRGILLKGWGGLSQQELPAEILSIDKAPHDWLFPQMQAVIHHGGAGTTHAGLWAGVPGLALPFFGDQEFWAQRLFGMGCGPRPISQAKLSQASLQESLQALISQPRYAKRASELSARMHNEGGVREAVALIKRFLGA